MPPARVSFHLQTVLIFAALALVFAFTVHARAPFFGHYAGPNDGLWRVNSEFALHAILNWEQWGPVAMRGKIQLNFASDPANGAMYGSYPPFYVILPWLIARISGVATTIRTLNVLSLIAHFSFGLAFAFWTRTLSRLAGLGSWQGTALAATAGSLLLAMPICVFFFQSDWWPDLIALPFFAAVALLDLSAQRLRARSWFPFLFASALTLALLSDWIAVPLCAVIWIKRRFDSDNPEERGHSAELAIPLGLLFLVLVSLNSGFGFLNVLFGTFKARLGIGDARIFFPVSEFLSMSFGRLGFPALVAGAVLLPVLCYFFARARGQKLRALAGAHLVLLFPVYLHFLATRQHYIDHPYAWIKFAFVMVSLPFVLLPLAAFQLAGFKRWSNLLVVMAVAAACGIGFCDFPSRYASGLNPAQNANLPEEIAVPCEALVPIHRPHDVYLSPDFANFDATSTAEPAPAMTAAGNACYLPIQLATTPARGALLRNKSERVVAIFRGEPPPDWLPLLAKASRRQTAGLSLYDFAP